MPTEEQTPSTTQQPPVTTPPAAPPATPPAAPPSAELEKQIADLQAQLKAAQDEAKKLSDADKTRQRESMTEADRLKAELADLQKQAADAEALRTQHETLTKTVKAQADAVRKELDIPTHVAELLDKMTPADQLDYLARNRATLTKQPPQKPNIDADGKGGGKAKTDKSQLRAKYGINRRK